MTNRRSPSMLACISFWRNTVCMYKADIRSVHLLGLYQFSLFVIHQTFILLNLHSKIYNLSSGIFCGEIGAAISHGIMKTSVLFCGSSQWDLMGRKELPARAEERGMSKAGRHILGPEVIPFFEGVNVTRVISGPVACHIVALSEDGEAYAWGRNEQGQLGFKNLRRHNVPKRIELPRDEDGKVCVVDAAVGRNHTLLLTNDGIVYSCGSNIRGQLGIGPIVQDPKYAEPQKVNMENIGIGKVVKVAAGAEFSMLLTDDGSVYSCGMPEYGQLGHGETGEYISGRTVSWHYELIPRRIESLAREGVKIKGIVCGANSSLALDDKGHIWTWGWGGYGRLGHNNPKDELIPKQVENIGNVISVHAGSTFHYVTTAYKQTYFWGQTKPSGEATTRPKAFHELSGFDVRDIAGGIGSTIVCGEESVASWGPSPCYGELGYGEGFKKLGKVVKSSTKPKVIDALEGCHATCVTMGGYFSAIVVRRETDKDEEIINALPLLNETDLPDSGDVDVNSSSAVEADTSNNGKQAKKRKASSRRGRGRSKKPR